MGRLSQLGALSNWVDNQEKLIFARRVLTKEQYGQLRRSYCQLFWAQLWPVLGLAVFELAVLLFMPASAVPAEFGDLKLAILMLAPALFIFPFYTVWMFVTQFAFGRLWHRYSRWYKNGKGTEELKALFASPRKK